MRKIFVTLSALSLAVVTSLPIVACNIQFNDPNVYRVTIVTDGGFITDHSFNESSYNAALQFKKEFAEWTLSNYADPLYKNKKVEISWDTPKPPNLNNLMASYNKGVFIDSKVIIASGFLHHKALVKAQNDTLKHKVKFIYVDGDTTNEEVPKENKQSAGLLYKAEQSGFLSGLAGAIWLTAHADDYGGTNNLKMSTYGAMDIPGVVNYMYGYYWAIQLFNNDSTNPIKDKLINWVKVLNPRFSGSLPKINFVHRGSQFSGTFDSAVELSRSINDALVDAGSDIIFPVAGIQIEDTIASLKAKESKGKIIGVDTDQQAQYPQAADRFITSAEKNLVNSIDFMLWESIGRKNDIPKHKIDPTATSLFTDDAPYRGGPGFTGIANNKAIKDIYAQLIALENDSSKLLDKVSGAWQKVLAICKDIGKDYWINGIKPENDPFK